jgi:hypothetical protein
MSILSIVLYTDGYNEWNMTFFVDLPICSQEYVEITKSYEKGRNNKTNTEKQ